MIIESNLNFLTSAKKMHIYGKNQGQNILKATADNKYS